MKTGELKKNLNKLNKNWKLVDNKLQINIEFKSFKKAFEFMQEIAVQSEILNHHPLWTNDYNKLEIKLYTHDKGRITELDFKLAKIIDDKLYHFKMKKRDINWRNYNYCFVPMGRTWCRYIFPGLLGW